MKSHYLFTCANDDLVHGNTIGQLGFNELADALRILSVIVWNHAGLMPRWEKLSRWKCGTIKAIIKGRNFYISVVSHKKILPKILFLNLAIIYGKWRWTPKKNFKIKRILILKCLFPIISTYHTIYAANRDLKWLWLSRLNEQSRECMKVYVLHTLQVIPVMIKSNEVVVVSQEDSAPNKTTSVV